MNRFYVSCDLGAETGRVMMGTLQPDQLTLSEVRQFRNVPVRDKGSLQWNIPQLYQEIVEGLCGAGTYDDPVDGISCSSWAGDYLLFEEDGSLITPTYHFADSRSNAAMEKMLSDVPWETVYGETGVQKHTRNTLFQLAAENPKRLKRASRLLPVADGFNFLLTGVPRLEKSLASTTQLYNPLTQNWSQPLLAALRLPPSLLPPLVSPGTELGTLRPELAKQTKLEDARVITGCSHETAAALAGLPIRPGENWAYLQPGGEALMGTQVPKPIINEVSRDLNFTNELGYGGMVCFYKRTVGLWMFEECQRFWQQADHALGEDMLSHLAGSATPFESLINPADPRFNEPGDMPLKIQAFCKETHQPIPRKPGPMYRCILESLSLLYRKLLREIAYLSGADIERLYILGGSSNSLFHHFIANALQMPVVIAPVEAASIGNIMVQALALGHVQSLEQAREIVAKSFKLETIVPHATAWNAAFERFATLFPG